MNHNTQELRQNVHGLQCCETPIRVMSEQRQPGGTNHMQPVQLPIDLTTCLIRVKNWLGLQRCFQIVLETCQSFGRQVQVQDDGSIAEVRATNCLQDFAGSFEWNEMRDVQVHPQSMYSRTVLYPCGYEFRKICLLLVLAIRTGFRVCVIFSDVQSNFWEVVNLSDLLPADFNTIPGMPACAQSSHG